MSEAVILFLDATVRTATPLALAAIGEVVVERSGVINIGLEGAIIAGAFGALVGATSGSVAAGFAAAGMAGILVGGLAAIMIAWLRADQIVTGTAITLLGFGTTGLLYRTMYGASGAGLTIPTATRISIPGLADIPWLGTAFFSQPLSTFVVYALIAVVWWILAHTHLGLAIRACGENPFAATVAGLDQRRIRTGSLLFGGLCGGLAGGSLVLAQSGTFIEGMSAGRGFIAIAIVVLGGWHAAGAAGAALLFGGALAFQYLLQAIGSEIPHQLVLALPYVLTLAVLAGVGGRSVPPAALGRLDEERS